LSGEIVLWGASVFNGISNLALAVSPVHTSGFFFFQAKLLRIWLFRFRYCTQAGKEGMLVGQQAASA
jgi:hypothetical protein